jgi:hypothetical protein
MTELLKNAAFGAAPDSPRLLIGVTGQGSPSAAPSWHIWNNFGPTQTRGRRRLQQCAYTSTAVIDLSTINAHEAQLYCNGAHDFLKRPPVTEQVMEVVTNGNLNGIVQSNIENTPSNQKHTLKHTLSSVWVFVLRGQVGMGTGNGGNVHIDRKSSKKYEWEELPPTPNGVSPVNEFVVYSVSDEGAWYFVANASVIDVDDREPRK